MEVIIGWDKITDSPPAATTIGTFDGVHLGHRKIIAQVLSAAANDNLISTLVTFEPHPKTVVQTDSQRIKVISNLEEKLVILQEIGLERIVVCKFTREFSEMDYSHFVREILYERLNSKEIVIGYDHAFGKNRQGSISELSEFARELGFKLQEVGPLKLNGQTVSSSRIRKALNEGDVTAANEMLGRNYTLQGIIVKGEGRGKKMNFPTANIHVDSESKLMPKIGVYVVDCILGDKKYRGMANIGFKPTFGGDVKTVEVHVFGFDRDIYGEEMTIQFLRRLRDEVRFNNEAELIAQLNEDKRNSIKN